MATYSTQRRAANDSPLQQRARAGEQLSHAKQWQLFNLDYPEWEQYSARERIRIMRDEPGRKKEIWAASSARMRQLINDLVREAA